MSRPSTAAELTDEIAGRLGDADSLVVGPGLVGDTPPTRLLGELSELSRPDTLFVIDALAIGAFADLDERRREMLASRVVMTPNRQEVLRIGGCPEDADLPASLRAAAHGSGAVITSFGMVQAPDGRCWRTTEPSSGLGTSGSGDVLAGLVGGAAARCRDPLQAACWATYAHMESGGTSAANATAGYLARAAGPRAAVPADLSQFPITQGAQRGREPLERRRAAAR